ncbi:unnamed protein product [Diatraea saccharalis]|uniref:Uncharacterized protein n=1 Tax=Diatraea saccharalis TaxID=40085 RepID=A0A9N9QZV0_9NEOP|nr:unnamed protein product [Diatraea saccharalis]
MSEAKKKRRQYCADYIKYGCIENPTNPSSPLCLICKKTFSNEAMKPSRLQDHFNKIHPHNKDKDVTYFQDMKKKYEIQPTISKLFSSASKQDDDGLRASYNISLLIAKTGKPHTIGEDLILPAIKEVITTVLHKPAADIIRKIHLSNSSVQRRIDEMAKNIEESLCNYLQTCQFSIQLEESILPTNEALLLSYVRSLNKIRSNSLNDRLFSQLCIANDEDFNRLLLHTEVRWLSKGTCLTRFYNLFGSVIEFLENKDPELRDNLISSKKDIAYLTDLYKLFNDVNLQLQGDDLNLIKTKNSIAAFLSKLLLYKRNIGRREFNNFPNLSRVSFNNEDLLVYCQHLENLHRDFKEGFQDVLNMDIPDWVLDPFSNVNTTGSSQLEEELIELTTNEELKIKFKNGYREF